MSAKSSSSYNDMRDRAALLYSQGRKIYSGLTAAEQSYVTGLLDAHLAGDRSRGGYSAENARYIERGGKRPLSYSEKEKMRRKPQLLEVMDTQQGKVFLYEEYTAGLKLITAFTGPMNASRAGFILEGPSVARVKSAIYRKYGKPSEKQRLFTTYDLQWLKDLTERNEHTQKMIYIAEKAGEKDLQKKLQEVEDRSLIDGYLTPENDKKRMMLWDQLKRALYKKVSEGEYYIIVSA